jgi:radical SAM protein with 4Fe4S-binding SPASM domain
VSEPVSARRIREIDLHVTNRCNLTCAHCSVDSGRTPYAELPLDVWRAVIDQAVAMGCEYFDLTGGEPVLYPGVDDIIRHVTGVGRHLELQTNGLYLTREKLQRLHDAGLRELVISLDGERATHDRMRGRIGAFDETLGGIRRAIECGFSVRITRVIARDEDVADFEPFARRLDALGVAQLSLNRFSPVTPVHFLTSKVPEAMRWRHFIDDIERVARTVRYRITYEVGYASADEMSEYGDEEVRCLIERRKWFLIRADGDVFPCYHFVHSPMMSLGNVARDPLAFLAGDDNPAWRRYAAIADVPAECSGCAFHDTCRGGCPSPGYLQRGSLALKDPRCAVDQGLVPICPFIKRTAGTQHRTNISPYYYAAGTAPAVTAIPPDAAASR